MWDEDYWDEEPTPDHAQEEAREQLRQFFRERSDQVFFSRQVEVMHESQFFHWVTNRAIRDLVDEGEIRTENRQLEGGVSVKLLWYRSFRYYRRSAAEVVKLVDEYSNPNISSSVGLHGEWMVLDGFTRFEFVRRGRETRQFQGQIWTATKHNIDFIFERDAIAYGIEVKNTLGYMDHREFQTKIRLCKALGLRPVFAVRMLPKSWINELIREGGFALIFKYQLYPWTHQDLAKRVASTLSLPVDAPRALEDGTMYRFIRWHEKKL